MPDRLFADRAALGALCRQRHIRRLSLFGSVLKGGARPDSDVDLLVEFSREARPSFLDLAEIEQELSALLAGRRVDLRTAEDLSRYFRDEVLREAQVQYESRDRVRLQHLANALNSAIRFARGRERDDLDTDEMLLFALVRAIEIAGEAASQVTAKTRHPTAGSAVGFDHRNAKPAGACLFRHQPGHPLDYRGRSGSSAGGTLEECACRR